jgi:hypothetical protein
MEKEMKLECEEKEGTWSRDLENWSVSSKMEKEATWSRDLQELEKFS